MRSYLVIDDVVVWSRDSGPVIQPTPAPVPVPTPPPVSGSNQVFEFPEQSLYPVTPGNVQAPIAIPFVSNTNIAPLGILIHFVDQKPLGTNNTWNISTQPNDMTPMFPFGSTVSGGTGVLVLRFGYGTSGGPDQNCLLPANTQLYLNLGSGSSQLWWKRRTDP